MGSGDIQWIGQTLFVAKGKLTSKLQLWWSPPQVGVQQVPSPETYHLRQLFLWMPRKMWSVDFKCPKCPSRSLRSKGLYNHVRLVVGSQDMYYLATEYMDCLGCKGTYQAWDDKMLCQLTSDVRAWFPAILTRKYACDLSLLPHIRERTLGNSVTAFRNKLLAVHSQQWALKNLSYLGDCERHM